MPTDTRPREASDAVTMHRVRVPRLAGGEAGIAALPPEDLLPSGGADHRGGPGSVVGADPGFRARVEAIRAQLAPMRSRAALASSFGREAHVVTGSALAVAYALRWLELAGPEPVEAAWSEDADASFA